jgi:methionyl-tRNA formyltransferase
MVAPMGARLALFTLLRSSYATVRDWAELAGYELVVLVTVHDGAAPAAILDARQGAGRTALLAVPSVADCALPLAGFEVDLGIAFGFRIIPATVAQVPRHGCVNLHPSLLPHNRGINGYRSLYAAEPEIGATLHWLTESIDRGRILAQAQEPTPLEIDPEAALEARRRVATAVLELGVPRALRDEPGEAQDDGGSLALPFTEEETVLRLELSAHEFQSRMSALLLAGLQPWLALAGERLPLRAASRLPGVSAQAPGAIEVGERYGVVAVADAVLRVNFGKLPS